MFKEKDVERGLKTAWFVSFQFAQYNDQEKKKKLSVTLVVKYGK